MIKGIMVMAIVAGISVGAADIEMPSVAVAPANVVLTQPVGSSVLQPAANASVLNSNDTIKEPICQQ